MQKKLAIIGECMLEINLGKSGAATAAANPLNADLSFGGDTLNTALYLSRLGFPVDYVTALGDDKLSDWMLQQWHNEGVGCELVARHPGATPGMYLIETDAQGERTFLYWRDQSPARKLLDNPGNASALFSRLREFKAIYLSGISLAISSPYARECLFTFLMDFRADGGKVIFDGNYRPKLWGSPELTRQAYQKMYRLADIALPTLEDEQALFEGESAEDVIQRLQDLGVSEIVLKNGPEGCEVITEEGRIHVPANKVIPVDTTAAGDSFNAGYLAHRLSGSSAVDAAKSGHNLASLVIQRRGAIIPRSAMGLDTARVS